MTTTSVRSPVTAYAEAVVSGATVTGRYVRLACERHLRDLKRKDIYFDDGEAQRAIDFFGFLTLTGGAADGKPFILEAWECFIVGSLHGWKNLDGTRRFRVAYIEIGKGNGKSPLAAGEGLYMLTADGEQRAEVYSAAVDKDQAKILFRDAVAMVKASPALMARLSMSGGAGNEWNIAYLESGSFFRPMSSEHTEGRGKSGFRVHCGLLDELHEHPTSSMVDFVRANAKGTQSLIFEITNSGWNKTTVCYQHHDLSVRVVEGTVDNDAWFAYVCSLDPCEACRLEGKQAPDEACADCDDWTDERVWIKANPNLGVSVTERYLRELVNEALAMPAKQAIVQRLNFCLWTTAATRWLSDELWEANTEEPDVGALMGQECYAGLVVSSTYDITSLTLWFPDSQSVLWWFWVPEERVEERRQEMVPYDVWVRDGFIETTPGNRIDLAHHREKLNQLAQIVNIRSVATKRWNATQLQTWLQDDGFDVVELGDGYKDMSDPTKELEKLLSQKVLKLGKNPVARWMAANIAVKIDAGEQMRPDKEKSTERFDGIEGLIMAMALGLSEEVQDTGVMFV